MHVRQLLNCQVSAWLPAFQHTTYRTRLIELPADFTEFLVTDGVYLPEGSAALPTRVRPTDQLDDYQDWSEDEEPSQTAVDHAAAADRFRGLLDEVQAAIEELGGAVTPKLNWSCPSDAVWLATGGSHRCTNAEEVLLLLKGSDRVAHDLCHALDGWPGTPPAPLRFTLALRKWHALRPEREFRCFVRGHDLVGVSQRRVSEHFAGLAGRWEELLEALLAFFEAEIENRFPDADFTFDVYVTSAGKVKLLDFNPVGGTTSPLLFSWEELGYGEPQAAERAAEPAAAAEGQQNGVAEAPSVSGRQNGTAVLREGEALEESGGVQFRVVEQANRVQPNLPTHGVPFDMVDTSEGGAVDELLARLREADLQQRQEG